MSKSLIKIVKFPKVFDDCWLVFGQHPTQVPFKIKRLYFILNAKKDLPRGFHAHHKTRQILFCIQGRIRIILDNGKKREDVVLKNPEEGVFLDQMIWHEMVDFRKNTILLILASREYEEHDYIRDYDEFLKLANKEKLAILHK